MLSLRKNKWQMSVITHCKTLDLLIIPELQLVLVYIG